MYYRYCHSYYMAALQSQRQIALGSHSAGGVAKRDEYSSEYLKRYFSLGSGTCLIEGEG